MTREESRAARRAIAHADYMKRRDARLAYAKEYYRKHRRKIIQQTMNRYILQLAGEWQPDKPYLPPSTEACEAELPTLLRMNKASLRQEFLAIPIHKRPSYDYFLRCKTVEHLREKQKVIACAFTKRSD